MFLKIAQMEKFESFVEKVPYCLRDIEEKPLHHARFLKRGNLGRIARRCFHFKQFIQELLSAALTL